MSERYTVLSQELLRAEGGLNAHAQGLRPNSWPCNLFPLHRTQGRAHYAEPAPQAPSQSYGTPIHASLITAAAFEGGWRPRLAHQLMIQCVETASLGKHRVRVGLMMGSWPTAP